MNLTNLRWPVVFGTMAIALGALFGGSFVLDRQTVAEPLKSIYTGSPVIETHAITRENDRQVITVRLKETADLAGAYKLLNDDTKRLLKDAPFTLKVEDHRSPELEQLFRRVNLFVQEALATGQFSAMADRVAEEAEKVGVTVQFTVDSERVYISLRQGEHYLYSVVERQPAKVSGREGGFGL